MNELKDFEIKNKLILPEIYKTFYTECEKKIPKKYVGSDIFNTHKELKKWAIELLNEDDTENFLELDDFVFLMHQGYMFWYFKADGTEDPIVYFYMEKKLKPKKVSTLKSFLEIYPQM